MRNDHFADFMKALKSLDGEFPGADLDPSLTQHINEEAEKKERQSDRIINFFLFLVIPALMFAILCFFSKLIGEPFTVSYAIKFIVLSFLFTIPLKFALSIVNNL